MIMELERAGLAFVGKDETGKRMEVTFFLIIQVFLDL